MMSHTLISGEGNYFTIIDLVVLRYVHNRLKSPYLPCFDLS